MVICLAGTVLFCFFAAFITGPWLPRQGKAVFERQRAATLAGATLAGASPVPAAPGLTPETPALEDSLAKESIPEGRAELARPCPGGDCRARLSLDTRACPRTRSKHPTGSQWLCERRRHPAWRPGSRLTW
jgi:hypothetical protein